MTDVSKMFVILGALLVHGVGLSVARAESPTFKTDIDITKTMPEPFCVVDLFELAIPGRYVGVAWDGAGPTTPTKIWLLDLQTGQMGGPVSAKVSTRVITGQPVFSRDGRYLVGSMERSHQVVAVADGSLAS